MPILMYRKLVLLAACLALVVIVLLRAPGLAVHGALLLTLLAAQAALGVANVVASQPLALAVAHNAGAALLLTIVVVLNFTVFQRHET